MTAKDPEHAILFDEVQREELEQISKAREGRLQDIRQDEPWWNMQVIGLALSGGGVRSATFGLGVLQGLARSGLLRHLDYMSSTGGGAQIAGWLLRWIQARGFREVEDQLSGKNSPNIEAAEIQALRSSIALPKHRTSSIALLARVRNVVINLVTLAAVLGAAILLTRIAVERLSWVYGHPIGYLLVAFSITAVLLLLLQIKKSSLCPPTQLRTFFVALSLSGFATVLVRVGMTVLLWANSLSILVSILIALAIASFCLILGLSKPVSVKKLLVHVGAALAAGALGCLLFFFISVLFPLSPIIYELDSEQIHWQQTYEWMQLTAALIVVAEAASLALYALLLKDSLSRGARELFWRVGRTLIGFAALSGVVVLAWVIPLGLSALAIIVLILLTGLGFLNVLGVQHTSRVSRFLIDTLESSAPYTFGMALTGLVAVLLRPFTQVYSETNEVLEAAIAAGLILISGLLLWLIKAREFTRHRIHRSRIVREYLAPAVGSPPVGAGTANICLGTLTKPKLEGPYPLFGAALDVAPDPSAQKRTIPFIFAPLFSGFELPRQRNQNPSASEAYRATHKLGGGISLASAIAISQPIRGKSFPRPSGAVSMLWTIFNLRDGRFMGNPIQDDTWEEQGPFIEPLYALREDDLPAESPFVRPYPSEDFDYLGIYELVKRRCKLIIACDVTSDPHFNFEHLGKTILRCRTHLGVDIQMDLGPLGRTPATSVAHFQVAQLLYGNGQDGFMLYIKPSLTGDEPTALVQYARTHAEFPARNANDGRFGESDFESYRRLGQHIVESVFAEIKVNAEMHTDEVVSSIRRKLQPDFKEPETTPSAEETDEAVAIPPELVEALASEECVLCTGSGLAAQSKLPTWPALLDSLLRMARENRVLEPSIATGLASTLAAGEYEAAADELTHQVSRDLLLQHVRSVTLGSTPSRAHRILGQMKFLGALNLSIDELLAIAFQTTALVPAQADKLVGELQSRKFFIANLFGTASQPSSLLFTMKEFRHLLLGNSQLKQFIGTLFLRYTVVFVGLGLDGLRDFMDALELPQTPERRHYVILPNANHIDPVKIRFFERSYNIRVVDYQPQFNYEGFPNFLDKLRKAITENEPQFRVAEPLTLKSVTLENIGPFHSLHVELTPGWNLLLGDNGVGKTIVLKSIAAALCGDKADSGAVMRLLRTGATTGSIRLKDEHREYTMSLERNMDGSIQITSTSLSPIIHERWLCLGFPALRSIPLVDRKDQNLQNGKLPHLKTCFLSYTANQTGGLRTSSSG